MNTDTMNERAAFEAWWTTCGDEDPRAAFEAGWQAARATIPQATLTDEQIAEIWTRVSGRPLYEGSTAHVFARALLTQAK